MMTFVVENDLGSCHDISQTSMFTFSLAHRRHQLLAFRIDR
jgi:hypothetical protein